MIEYIKRIQSGENLDEQDMINAMTQIMDGQASEIDMKDFLISLSEKGESVSELTGAAKVMREKALTINAPYNAVDCCGTGGDASGTYNISTAVALTAAACGVPVAKHGNRAASSKSGAADVLEALGVNLEMPPEKLEESLKTLHFAFLMAPRHHQAMKHVAQIRKDIGKRTIFNLIGPLSNPAGTRRQLIGVFDAKWILPMAETLKNLGSKKAWIVHGSDGLDEITITGTTQLASLDEDGNIKESELSPAEFGLPESPLEKLKGGSAEENAAALRSVLEGHAGAYRDIVLANTAAVLVVHGSASDISIGMKKAEEALDEGLAMQTLKDYIAFSRAA